MTTAQIDAALIIKCCENYITDRKQKYQAAIDAAIEVEMTPSKFPWSLFRKPAKTREEALDRLSKNGDHGGIFSTVSFYKMTYSYSAVNRVLTIAKNSDIGIVDLSDEDSYILSYA